jgi:RNA polymerase sigma factor (sigma-70 family)
VVRKLESLASESATLHAYLREIAGFPSLTLDDERQLGHQIQLDGDEEAIGRLVQANLRYVAAYVGRFRHLGVPLLELIHEGNLGLIEAARRFDPAREGPFQTHAAWWVRQAVMHLLGESPRVPEMSAAGLMAAAVAGRQPGALRVAIAHALAPAPEGAGEHVTDDADPIVPLGRRKGRKARKGRAASRIDLGALQSLRQQTVLRSYLN